MELGPLCIPYVGEASIRFVKALSRLCLKQFDVKLLPLYRTNKVEQYFQLKSETPLPLCSNVVYEFTCSCDTNLTYIGMSSRHLITRVKEHLNLADSRKSAIKDQILSCPTCSNLEYNINSFIILKKCNSDYEAKIHDALLIKRHSPSFNKQCYATGASFLLNILYINKIFTTALLTARNCNTTFHIELFA